MTEEIITPIFQFGTSRFLQAHAALFLHEAMSAGDEVGPITVVAISGSLAGRARLQALARVQRRIGGFLRWVPEERREQSPSLANILSAVDQNADRQNVVQ
ncbi:MULTISPECIES: hypothetical protein [unclassified Mesorhizobium]|uniref:hypothetical protein n=1 Tax=unclassified Mesorhizobium TaxID=325217 RepID=UPI00163D8E29|nr:MULTISPECIES: hypothetical protein [unclassified Mesorhizobium]